MNYLQELEAKKLAKENTGRGAPGQDLNAIARLALILSKARTNNVDEMNEIKNRLNSLDKQSRVRFLDLLTPFFLERMAPGPRKVVTTWVERYKPISTSGSDKEKVGER